MPAAKADKAAAKVDKHPSGLSADARQRVLELIAAWEDKTNRDLPLIEHLRAVLAD
jgi:hypothetical protein